MDDVAVRFILRDNLTLIAEPARLFIGEGDSATYGLRLATPPSTGNTVSVSVTGATGTDATVTHGTLAFTEDNWNVNQRVTITTAVDSDDVDDMFVLTNTATGGGYDNVTVDVPVTIRENDSRGVTASPDILQVQEGSTSTYSLVLEEAPLGSKNETGDVQVRLSVPRDAGFTVHPNRVTFTRSDWSAEQHITITARHDSDHADHMAAITHIATGGGYEGAPTDSVDVTVIDDETPGVTIVPNELEIDEGGSDSYTVVLDVLPDDDVTVTVVTPGTGDISVDRSTLTFTTDDWDTPQIVRVDADHDPDALDDTGSITHTVSSSDTGYNGIDAPPVEVTVIDDEDIPVRVSFEQSLYNVAESDDPDTTGVKENEVTVRLVLSEDPERTVTVPIITTNQGGATSTDYRGVPASVTFGLGDTEETFTFTANDDDVDDDDESVLLTFGSPLPPAVGVGTTSEAVVNIDDDDKPTSVDVNFEETSYMVTEGNSVAVKITLSDDPEQTFTIPLTRTELGNATSTDYEGVPADVTFKSGDTEKSFMFRAAADNLVDPGESVRLGFRDLPDGVNEGTASQTTVRISDVAPQETLAVSFESAGIAVTEGATTTVAVKLNAAPGSGVTIPLVRAELGATSTDYSGVPDGVTFGATSTEESFTFRARQDTIDDDDESVQVTFGPLPAGITEGSPSETLISIIDDDKPAWSLSSRTPNRNGRKPVKWQVTWTTNRDNVTSRWSRRTERATSTDCFRGFPGVSPWGPPPPGVLHVHGPSGPSTTTTRGEGRIGSTS